MLAFLVRSLWDPDQSPKLITVCPLGKALYQMKRSNTLRLNTSLVQVFLGLSKRAPSTVLHNRSSDLLFVAKDGSTSVTEWVDGELSNSLVVHSWLLQVAAQDVVHGSILYDCFRVGQQRQLGGYWLVSGGLGLEGSESTDGIMIREGRGLV